MNINQFKNNGDHKNIPPLDAGTYSAVCSGVIDIGTHMKEWKGEETPKNQLILMFDFPTETIEIDGKQMPRCLSLKLTKSMHENAMFRKHLIAWRGRDFTDEELNDFALSKLLGAPVTIGIIQKEYKGKIYANISTLGKATKGTEQKATRKIYFDMGDETTYSAIEELPDWIVTLINKSAEAIATKQCFMKNKGVTKATEHVDDATDNDVPF